MSHMNKVCYCFFYHFFGVFPNVSISFDQFSFTDIYVKYNCRYICKNRYFHPCQNTKILLGCNNGINKKSHKIEYMTRIATIDNSKRKKNRL